jgi:hypothetical protein
MHGHWTGDRHVLTSGDYSLDANLSVKWVYKHVVVDNQSLEVLGASKEQALWEKLIYTPAANMAVYRGSGCCRSRLKSRQTLYILYFMRKQCLET